MKKKSVIIIILTTIMLASSVSPAFAGVETKLYDMYGSNMLFQQKAVSEIAGTGNPNTKIKVEIYNNKNRLVITNTDKVNNDGRFSVSFRAPEGSFNKYKIIVKANNKQFAVLKNVLFGELWIASGQSNMHYPLAQAEGAEKDFENKAKQSEYIRVMTMPTFEDLVSEDGSVKNLPLKPCEDVKGAQWVTGENDNIYGVSAVAFYFANKLMDKLNVPVGFLNAPLGGTQIATWLSRDAIESNKKVKAYLNKRDMYISEKAWTERDQNIYLDMTANYNLRISPIQKFAVSGMVWYQGESDIMLSANPEEYKLEFDLLQKSYSKLFGFTKKEMPIIFTQLASFIYSDDGMILPETNVAFSEIQKASPSSRALVTSYDITPEFTKEVGCIHPKPKREIGERMALCALSLVYNGKNPSTIPYIKSSKIKSGKIYVTLDNIGDGLIKKGKKLRGFSICDETGVYVNAEAEIVSKDTVKIWSNSVKNPKSATYAYSATNNFANLYSEINGKEYLPVSPFITDKNYNTRFFKENHWIDCSEKTVWHNDSDAYSGFYPSWESESCNIAFSSDNSYSNDKGMGITSTEKSFSVKPLMTYTENNKELPLKDVETDFSHYGTISFYIRNDGEKPITLEGVNFYKSDFTFYTPLIKDSGNNEMVIPADTEWHHIILDLNNINFRSNECGIAYSNNKLSEITNISFNFSSQEDNSAISLDNISFSPSETLDNTTFAADTSAADSTLQKISAFFVNLIGNIF